MPYCIGEQIKSPLALYCHVGKDDEGWGWGAFVQMAQSVSIHPLPCKRGNSVLPFNCGTHVLIASPPKKR